MAPQKNIVIFEDRLEKNDEMKKHLVKELKGNPVSVLQFPLTKAKATDQSFEKRIEKELTDKLAGDVILIICDRDLSGTSNYRGLSEAAVSKVAEKLGIPVCVYAQGMRGTVIERAQEWSNRQIILDHSSGIPEMAKTAAIAATGFIAIAEKYRSLMGTAKQPKTAAQSLAAILSRPELSDRLALYGSGDLSNLTDVFTVDSSANKPEIAKRMARMLGLWHWDSIMRFPGILLNETAAASYLDLSLNSFKKSEVQKFIKSACYAGPFHGTANFWWRDIIDNIVSGGGFISGYEAMKALKKGVTFSRSKCHIDGKSPAGYFCMFREKPVSERNSKGNLSWFPSGADLSRISDPDYDEFAPWLGLY